MSAFEAQSGAVADGDEAEVGRSDGETARPAETLFRRRLAQAVAAFRIELGQQLRGLGAVGLSLLALLLSLPWAIAWLVRLAMGRGPELAETTGIFAGLFQGFELPMVLFFGCVVVFTGVARRDLRQRTLHHYLLCPVRREVLLAGRFAAGVAVSSAFLAAGTVLAYALAFGQLAGAEGFALRDFFTAGPGLGHLAAYLAVVLLGCVGYGAVFTALGLYVRNPILPVIGVLGWEALTPFLPPGLKAITIYHYLRGLCPVPVAEGPFALLAEPPSPWLAVPGLLAVCAVLLALAAGRMRRLEIDYGDE